METKTGEIGHEILPHEHQNNILNGIHLLEGRQRLAVMAIVGVLAGGLSTGLEGCGDQAHVRDRVTHYQPQPPVLTPLPAPRNTEHRVFHKPPVTAQKPPVTHQTIHTKPSQHHASRKHNSAKTIVIAKPRQPTDMSFYRAKVAAEPRVEHIGQGGWVTNTPFGYLTGRKMKGDTFSATKGVPMGHYVYGKISSQSPTHQDLCGWVEVSQVKPKELLPSDTSCKTLLGPIYNRYNFGKEFNCGPHKCVDGTIKTPVNKTCDQTAYYNYAPAARSFNNLGYPRTKTGFYNRAGKLLHKYVHYRYTTKDSKVALVRSVDYGWVFINRSCLTEKLRGGPLLQR